VAVVERAGDGLEQLFAAVPRLSALLVRAEGLVVDVGALVARIEATRAETDDVVRRTGATAAAADAAVAASDALVVAAERLVVRFDTLLASFEPSLTKLQPPLERLAETTDPAEVDALVSLVDNLPQLASQLERDLLPVLRTLGTVAPDLHDMLEASRELNGMLAQLPGMGRIKKKVEEQQENPENQVSGK